MRLLAALVVARAAAEWTCDDVPYPKHAPKLVGYCEGLQQLDEALEGGPSARLGWGPNAGDVCAWPGVQCNLRTQVTAVEIGSLGFNGTLASTWSS